MFWLKGCGRCGGDAYVGEDLDGKYLACMQCGHHLSYSETMRLVGGRRLPVSEKSAASEHRAPLQAVA